MDLHSRYVMFNVLNLDGLDNLNTLCECGAEIGTEKSDCWMPHCILLRTRRVSTPSRLISGLRLRPK
jgi:hypothetical protein